MHAFELCGLARYSCDTFGIGEMMKLPAASMPCRIRSISSFECQRWIYFPPRIVAQIHATIYLAIALLCWTASEAWLWVKLDGRVCLESGTLDAGQQKFTRPLGASHVYPITKQTTHFSGAYHAISMFLLPKTWSRSDRHCSPDFDPSGYPQPRADLSARRLQQLSLI